uniref:Uncharacterized protein n=1 Tax=Gadus morhua TaxID=8049 RepID=A0A8C5BTA7_GADMO
MSLVLFHPRVLSVVGSALLCIVAGCIIIGVSRECDADAVGGIFLGAGGLGECPGSGGRVRGVEGPTSGPDTF